MNIGTPSLPPLALIAGPTASGKSALAITLAERADGVIINADSAQVYDDLRIVSARPDKADEARVPHRLYGYRDGALPCSAADWAADAKGQIEAAHAAGKLPILVGGTGMYIRTLLEGIAPVPEIDGNVRAEVRGMSVELAYGALLREDVRMAHCLNPTDTTRVARALEVIRSTGRSLSHWQQDRVGGISGHVGLRPLILLPPRPWLHERCDQRFAAMLQEEGLEEVRRLVARELDPSRPVMRAIGVSQLTGFLQGKLTREEALAAGQAATRQYAKRQYTWFRRQMPQDWDRFDRPPDVPGAIEQALLLLGESAQIA